MVHPKQLVQRMGEMFSLQYTGAQFDLYNNFMSTRVRDLGELTDTALEFRGQTHYPYRRRMVGEGLMFGLVIGIQAYPLIRGREVVFDVAQKAVDLESLTVSNVKSLSDSQEHNIAQRLATYLSVLRNGPHRRTYLENGVETLTWSGTFNLVTAHRLVKEKWGDISYTQINKGYFSASEDKLPEPSADSPPDLPDDEPDSPPPEPPVQPPEDTGEDSFYGRLEVPADELVAEREGLPNSRVAKAQREEMKSRRGLLG